MIQINDQIISLEVLREEFVCNLSACKGACCVHGDSGAPLDKKEMVTIAKEFSNIRPYLRPEGVESIESQGTSVKDKDGDWVTPLREGKECAFTVFEKDGTAKCGIEMAWNDGATHFRKPISCHLYPIRTKKYPTFEAVNYERWTICSDACSLGKELKVPVYKFLKDPLIRKYGAEWYSALEEAVIELDKMKQADQ
jgi:hypothetical protein